MVWWTAVLGRGQRQEGKGEEEREEPARQGCSRMFSADGEERERESGRRGSGVLPGCAPGLLARFLIVRRALPGREAPGLPASTLGTATATPS